MALIFEFLREFGINFKRLHPSYNDFSENEANGFLITKAQRLRMHKKNGERVRDAEGFRLRAAGVCLRGEGSGREILLVSSGKDERRWVIPGGGIEKGEDAPTAALREVLEEAGVKGQIVTKIGEFRVSIFFIRSVSIQRKRKFLEKQAELNASWQLTSGSISKARY